MTPRSDQYRVDLEAPRIEIPRVYGAEQSEVDVRAAEIVSAYNDAVYGDGNKPFRQKFLLGHDGSTSCDERVHSRFLSMLGLNYADTNLRDDDEPEWIRIEFDTALTRMLVAEDETGSALVIYETVAWREELDKYLIDQED